MIAVNFFAIASLYFFAVSALALPILLTNTKQRVIWFAAPVFALNIVAYLAVGHDAKNLNPMDQNSEGAIIGARVAQAILIFIMIWHVIVILLRAYAIHLKNKGWTRRGTLWFEVLPFFFPISAFLLFFAFPLLTFSQR